MATNMVKQSIAPGSTHTLSPNGSLTYLAPESRPSSIRIHCPGPHCFLQLQAETISCVHLTDTSDEGGPATPVQQIPPIRVGNIRRSNDSSPPASIRRSGDLRGLSRQTSQETGLYPSEISFSGASPEEPIDQHQQKTKTSRSRSADAKDSKETLQQVPENVVSPQPSVHDPEKGRKSTRNLNANSFNFGVTWRDLEPNPWIRTLICISAGLALIIPIVSFALFRTVALGDKNLARLIYLIGVSLLTAFSGIAVSLFNRNFPIMLMTVVAVLVFGIFVGSFLDLMASYPAS